MFSSEDEALIRRRRATNPFFSTDEEYDVPSRHQKGLKRKHVSKTKRTLHRSDRSYRSRHFSNSRQRSNWSLSDDDFIDTLAVLSSDEEGNKDSGSRKRSNYRSTENTPQLKLDSGSQKRSNHQSNGSARKLKLDTDGVLSEYQPEVIDLISSDEQECERRGKKRACSFLDEEDMIENVTPKKARVVYNSRDVMSAFGCPEDDDLYSGRGISSYSGKHKDISGNLESTTEGTYQSHDLKASATQNKSEAPVRSAWRIWLSRLLKKKPNIFESAEARLMLHSKARRGHSVYEGIGITTTNCLGLRKVLATFSRNHKSSFCCPEKTERELTTTVSQFLRWCVSSSSCKALDVWREDALFRNVAKVELVEQFMMYFQARCEDRTVRNKALHLTIVCEAASARESKIWMKGIIDVSMLLQTIGGKESKAAACKIQRQYRTPGSISYSDSKRSFVS